MRLLLAAALLLPVAAAAQPAATLAGLPGVERDRPLPPLVLSAGATAAGVGLALVVYGIDGRGGPSDPAFLLGAAAVALAPSAGNLWLGETSDALIGAALRTAGAVWMLYAIDNVNIFGPSSDATSFAALAGFLAYAGGLGYDIVTQTENGQRAAVALRPAGSGLALSVGL